MTGEISIPPKFGIHRLIGRNAGSVIRYKNSYIWKTNLFWVLIILNEVSQLIATTMMRHHIYNSIIWSIRESSDNIRLN
jgi:hypothetical protein